MSPVFVLYEVLLYGLLSDANLESFETDITFKPAAMTVFSSAWGAQNDCYRPLLIKLSWCWFRILGEHGLAPAYVLF